MSSEQMVTWIGPRPAAPGYIRRIAITSAWLAAVAAVLLWAATGGRWALGFVCGAALGVANFLLLAVLMREVVTLGPRSRRRIALLIAVKVVLVYGGLALLLAARLAPVLSVVIGFSLVLGVIVLKAVGRVLIGHATGRLRVLLVILVLLGAWAMPARAAEPASHAGAGEAPAVVETAPAHGEPGGHAEEAEAEEPPELPNAVHLLYQATGGHGQTRPAWITFLNRFKDVAYALLVAVIIIVIVRIGTRKMALIPGGAQNVVEFFIETFSNFILSILGPAGRPYVPFLGSLFLYIWFMNLIGLVPLMKSPTSALSTTAALAICVFLYVQWIGLRRLGPLKYLRHLAGDPQDAIGWGVAPLMFPLHVIGELARPVSLSLRLFGNILGEDVLIGIFAALGVAVVAFLKLPLGLPLHLPFILLAMLMSTVQALVFTLLSTVYIMQVLPHDDGEAGH